MGGFQAGQGCGKDNQGIKVPVEAAKQFGMSEPIRDKKRDKREKPLHFVTDNEDDYDEEMDTAAPIVYQLRPPQTKKQQILHKMQQRIQK